MSKSFLPLTASNDDVFNILSMEGMLRKKLTIRIFVRVCLFTVTTDQIEKTMRNDKQAPSFSLHTPGLPFFPCFFPLLITEMIFPKLAGENTACRAACKHPGKPLQGQV